MTTSEVDVFSKDGIYLYRMTWPFLPQVIKGGFLYEVRQDESAGLTRIVRIGSQIRARSRRNRHTLTAGFRPEPESETNNIDIYIALYYYLYSLIIFYWTK